MRKTKTALDTRVELSAIYTLLSCPPIALQVMEME